MIGPTQDPLLRVISLHDLNYCRRLFYLTEVEGLQAPNAAIYAGRELHASLAADEDGERTQLELTDPVLGLVGKVDAIRHRDGSLIPYEHKRGKARRDGKVALPWPSDRLQVVAYAVLIESATNQTIPEGRVRYHADNVTIRVPIDNAARSELSEAIATARVLRESDVRPPVAENERLCVRCSLAPVCLPEETRQAENPDREATRLFPPDRDGTSLHVVTPGARVGRSGDTLVVTPPDGESPSKHAIREIDSLIIHGQAQATTQALVLCADREIPVHWISTSGHHTASLTSTAGQVQRRLRQYRALADEANCLRLAKALAHAKIEGQHRYLMRGSRGDSASRDAMLADLVPIRSALASIEGVANRDSLLGFGYGLLHTAVMRAVLASGLEPALGFFHTPRSSAYPLVLDLMELFRVPLWDMVLLGSLNRGQWDPISDFAVTKAKVWLSDPGKKKAIGLFETRLDETWKHLEMIV